MKLFIKAIIALGISITLFSCEGDTVSSRSSKSDKSGGSDQTPQIQLSVSEQIDQEVQEVNEEINQGNQNYTINKGELDDLLRDGVITQEKYNELMAFAQ